MYSGETEIYLHAEAVVAAASVSREDESHRGVLPLRSSGSGKAGACIDIQRKGGSSGS